MLILKEIYFISCFRSNCSKFTFPLLFLRTQPHFCLHHVTNMFHLYPWSWLHLERVQMLLDPMGGVVITNDGNCILREVDVSHPTAKSMIELSRAQDEEVGDGTTSVIILAGEMLILSEPLIKDNIHPTIIVQGYNRALQEALIICERWVNYTSSHMFYMILIFVCALRNLAITPPSILSQIPCFPERIDRLL